MSSRLRIGYSFWGFLGDYKIEGGREISAPDGNATYSWSIVWEAMLRGHEVYPLMPDRDAEAVRIFGEENFASFSKDKRWRVWEHLRDLRIDGTPELDVVLHEWRMPVPGRNTPEMRGKPGYQPDLDMQELILHRYLSKGVPVIVWDLDHKMLPCDEAKWAPPVIFETSVSPRRQLIDRVSVDPPFVINDLLQFKTMPVDPTRKLVYIGSRYERDDVIQKWIHPVSERFPGQVEFWGNWTREPNLSQCKDMWPSISYHGRITPRHFREVYGTAVAVPLLAKTSYLQTGFMTPRPVEAVLFGSLPIGLGEHLGVDDYSYLKAESPRSVEPIVYGMSKMDRAEKDRAREEMAHQLRRMDASAFLDKIEAVVNGN